MNKEVLLDDIIKEKAGNEKLILPEELSIKIRDTIENLPERRRSTGRIKKTAAAAAIILIVLTCFGVAFPSYAVNVPFVGSVFQFLSNNNKIDLEYVEYSSAVNVSKTYKNIKITINSIVFDGVDLSIGYTVESKNEFKKEPSIFGTELKIDGKEASFGANGTGEFIDKHTFAGVDSYHLGNLYLSEQNKGNDDGYANIPNNVMVDFNIRTLFDNTKGKWDFKFNVASDKLKDKVKQVKTSIDLPEDGSNLKVDKVIFTPVNTAIMSNEDNKKGVAAVKYAAFDDKGRSLPEKNTSKIYLGDGKKLYWQNNFKNIYGDTKSVTFIPMTLTKENKEKMQISHENYKYDSKEIPLKLDGTTILSEGSFGEYKINKVEVLKDKTLIHYECTKYISAIGYDCLAIKVE